MAISYSFSDIAFIGGRIKDFGGHNPLEAAAYGAAIVMGESTFTVRDIVKVMDKSAGVLTVRDVEQAYKILEKFSLSPVLFQKVGLQSQSAWRGFRGAKARVLEVLNPYVKI